MDATPRTIALDDGSSVSGLWLAPPDAESCLVLAHGAGAGMTHRGMEALASGLAERNVATLRFQFPFIEKGSRRPDRPAVAHAAVRAAHAEAVTLAGALPVFAGGRSFGGRMTSQAHAASRLPDLRGIVFLAFPLHPAGAVATERAEHLVAVDVPLLFVAGGNDALSDLASLRQVVSDLGARATLTVAPGADHAFHVPRSSGRTDREILSGLLDETAAWMRAVARVA